MGTEKYKFDQTIIGRKIGDGSCAVLAEYYWRCHGQKNIEFVNGTARSMWENAKARKANKGSHFRTFDGTKQENREQIKLGDGLVFGETPLGHFGVANGPAYKDSNRWYVDLITQQKSQPAVKIEKVYLGNLIGIFRPDKSVKIEKLTNEILPEMVKVEVDEKPAKPKKVKVKIIKKGKK